MTTIISFIVIFGVLVFIHELGHLIFAKRAGILCREFAIGFGPKVFTFKGGETLYTIRLLPLGGFVRMAGEDPEVIEIKPGQQIGLILNNQEKVEKILLDKHDPRAIIIEVEKADLEGEYVIGYEEEESTRYELAEPCFVVMDKQEIQIAPISRQFASKTLLERTLTIFGGPLMNFLLAAVLLIGLGIVQGYPVNKSEVGEVTSSGAAAKAGLQMNDKVVSIDNHQVATWSDVVTIIRANPEKKMTFTIERNGQEKKVTVIPEKKEDQGKPVGMIGVYRPVESSFFGAITNGLTETVNWTKEIVNMFGKLITGEFSIDALSGPVGITVATGKVAESGISNLFRWAALLSLNLGIMNLLPFPALDGGRLMFFLVEALRGKPIDRHREGLVHFVGFAVLMLLMLVVTWNDIHKFFL